jgi:hypothetical protein
MLTNVSRTRAGAAVLSFAFSVASGCAAPEVLETQRFFAVDWAKADGELEVAIPELPWAGGAGPASPWGGVDPGRWSPEAVYANAVSSALNEAWADETVLDAVIAVPAQFFGSELRPYGDGQSNASIAFGSWSERRPPLVATLSRREAGSEVVFRLDRALPISGDTLEIVVGGNRFTATWSPDAQGDRIARWLPPAGVELGGSTPTPVWVRPVGWADGWGVHFAFPVREADAMIAEAPAAVTNFADGRRTVGDPEGVSALRAMDAPAPFDALMSHSFGPGYNQVPYVADDVHGAYPHRHDGTTAVGGSWAWLVQPPHAPFKQVYLCLEGRDLSAEASTGAPSGSGWHAIGDAAESLVLSLERAPLLAAWARRGAVQRPASLGGGAAYGLGDVATARLLRPGEAFLTRAGSQEELHWYPNHRTTETCAEIWIHPCTPSRVALTCEAPSSQVSFDVSSPANSGETLLVVGNVPALGGWNPSAGLALSRSASSWSGRARLPAGRVEWKLVRRSSAGNVLWESGPNRVLDVPSEGALTVAGGWR